MSEPQTNPARKCLVAQDYQAEFPGPIAVEAGEVFTVSEKTSLWEGNPAWIWLWCTDRRGKSGWVPQAIIQMEADGQTGTTRAAYDAREFTATAGQELTIEYEESGWFWCHDQEGGRGWIPLSHVVIAAPDAQ
jgi:uncharacterized protein YgiM (DUF1202 family)